MDRVQEAVPERTVRLVEMVFSVEGIQTVPAELILALRAFHEFAATSSLDVNLARRASLREEDFVYVTVECQLGRVETHYPLQVRLLGLQLDWRMPSEIASCTLERISAF